jgi:hypothetical protein
MAEKKLAEYEEIMRLIKEATGVSDISEVIAKFQSQGETHAQLSQLQKSNEAKIGDLKEKKSKLASDNEEMKFAGQSKFAHSQRTLEEFEKHLKESEDAYAEAKQKYERALKTLVNANAGVQHLADKLDHVKGVRQIRHNEKGEPVKFTVINDKNVVEALRNSTKKIEGLAASLQNKELPEARSEK